MNVFLIDPGSLCLCGEFEHACRLLALKGRA